MNDTIRADPTSGAAGLADQLAPRPARSRGRPPPPWKEGPDLALARRARRRLRRHRNLAAVRDEGVLPEAPRPGGADRGRARGERPPCRCHRSRRGARHPVAVLLVADPRRRRRSTSSFVLRADNKGEGGTLALAALVAAEASAISGTRLAIPILLALFGTGLLYGEGVITPAISVLSARRGPRGAEPAARPPRRPDLRRDPDRPVLGPALRHRPDRRGVRLGHAGVVPRDRRRRRAVHRARARGARRAVSPHYGAQFLAPPRRARVPPARLGRPLRHRLRGALRRHGPLRPHADPHRVDRGRVPRPAPQLLRPGRAVPRAGREASSNPFYDLVAGRRC